MVAAAPLTTTRGARGKRRHAKRAGPALLLGASVVLALGLSACGNDALSLARQSCVHVNASEGLYQEASHASSSHLASSERYRALEQLEDALPLAAAANSDNPQWNPLMTTLEEVGRNTIGHLLPALHRQCELADSNNPQAPAVAPYQPGDKSTTGT